MMRNLHTDRRPFLLHDPYLHFLLTAPGTPWLKNANCFGGRVWVDALADAKNLASGQCNLTDGSVAGDWRLPNVKGLQSPIDFSQLGPALPAGYPFLDLLRDNYWWSSTTNVETPDEAWFAAIRNGVTIAGASKRGFTNLVWPVRGPE